MVGQWGKMYLDRVQKQADGQGGLNCRQAASQVVPDRLPSMPTAVLGVVMCHVTVIS